MAQTANLANEMNADAQCMMDAFGQADDAMNDLADELDDMGLDWGREDDRDAVRDAIDDAKKRARDGYVSGGLWQFSASNGVIFRRLRLRTGEN